MEKTEGYVCSIMRVPNYLNKGKKVPNLMIGEQAEVDFIILRHAMKSGRTAEKISGFQGVSINMDSNRNGTRIWKVYDKDIVTGKPKPSDYTLWFFPNGIMNTLMAAVPDTEFNRDLLARDQGVSVVVAKSANADYNELMKDIDARTKKYKEELAKKAKKPKKADTDNGSMDAFLKEINMTAEDYSKAVGSSDYDDLRKMAKENVQIEYKKELDSLKDALTAKGSKAPGLTAEYKKLLMDRTNLVFQHLVAAKMKEA
jgi:hypothetical protein